MWLFSRMGLIGSAIWKQNLVFHHEVVSCCHVLCSILCIVCVVDLFPAVGGPCWSSITASVSQAWPSMQPVDCLPGQHAVAWSSLMTKACARFCLGMVEQIEPISTEQSHPGNSNVQGTLVQRDHIHWAWAPGCNPRAHVVPGGNSPSHAWSR
jgi:hypothetical protein